MSAPKPYSAREPSCIHYPPGTPDSHKQPASACSTCKDGPALQRWNDEWAAWLAENPDSQEAEYVREMDASRKRGGGVWWRDPVQEGYVMFSVAAYRAYNRKLAREREA